MLGLLRQRQANLFWLLENNSCNNCCAIPIGIAQFLVFKQWITKTLMAELKTKATKVSVTEFIKTIPDEQKRKDSVAIISLMQKATKSKPKLWGTAIIGFQDVKLKYDSGREVDWFQIGFSPRKANITLYLGAETLQSALLKKLGKHSLGRGCLYFKSLEQIDALVLKKLIELASKRDHETSM
jgi:hypothetical protein